MNRKYQLDTSENREFLKELCGELFDFGRQYPSEGGSCYYLGDDGSPMPERNLETYMTCRMVHVYILAEFLGYEGAKELADAGMMGIQGELRDRKFGGWYPSLAPDGSPNAGKLCYTHAFVILAASAAVMAGRAGAQKWLREALEVFERYYWDEEQGLSRDNWNMEFTQLDGYRGLNANMHTVEAYLAAADATGEEIYRQRVGRILGRVITWAQENSWRVPEHFDAQWKPDPEFNAHIPDDPFKPYGATPGHALEWARLTVQWALSSDVQDKEDWIAAAENLFLTAVQDAWYADGEPGFVYTTDWNGKPVVHDRMHWTLAEGINTAAVLYRVTGKQVYAQYYAQFMQYLDEKVADRKLGSWFHQMDRHNRVIGTVWPGKSDLYHAVQAMLIPYYECRDSIVLAVREGKRI